MADDPQPLAGQLKVGKPTLSYPTPDIADLFIIEQVDTNAGDYEALEYGTLYPDQVNHPNFKLVFQDPLSWRYIKRIWTADRTRESQNEYNLTLEYPWADKNYPRAFRTYVFPRDTYVSPDIETADVDGFGVLVDIKINPIQDQTLAGLYQSVTEVYDTIPPFNNGNTGRQQEFTAPADFRTTGQRISSTVVGSDQVLPALGEDGVGVVAASLQTVDALRNTLTTETDTAEIDPSVSSTVVDDGTQQNKGTVASEFGFPLTASNPAFLQVSSRVSNLQADKQRKDTLTVDQWRPLYGTSVDEVTGIVVDYVKVYVPNGTLGGVSGNTYTEITPYDAAKSISIASTIRTDTIPDDDLIIPISHELSLPDQLISIDGSWDTSTTVGISEGSDGHIAGSVEASVGGTPVIKIQAGFRGIALGTMTRRYSSTLPLVEDLVSPTYVSPAVGTVWVFTKSQAISATGGGSSTSINVSGGVQSKTVTVGPVLTNDFTSSNIAASAVAGPVLGSIVAEASGLMQVEIEPSVPVKFSYGDNIVVKVDVIQGRLGLWITEVSTVRVPAPDLPNLPYNVIFVP